MAATSEIINITDALCRACDGLGCDPKTFEACKKCAGTGMIICGCCEEECDPDPAVLRE